MPVGRRIRRVVIELKEHQPTRCALRGVKVEPMRKDTFRALTFSVSAALAVVMFMLGSSVAVADSYGHSGRSSMSSGRHVDRGSGRMGRSVRGGRVRDGRHSVRQDRGGRRYGWFNRDRGYRDRTYIGFGGGSRRGYRSSRGFFFGFSFSASEYRSYSGPRYRNYSGLRDYSGPRYRRFVRSENRSDVSRENDSNARRAALKHAPTESGPVYVPLVASPSAPEVLPLKD